MLFNRHHGWKLKSYKDINVEKGMDVHIFKFYKELTVAQRNAHYQKEATCQQWKMAQEVHAFELTLDGSKLLVLNHFYGSEVEAAIPKTTKRRFYPTMRT